MISGNINIIIWLYNYDFTEVSIFRQDYHKLILMRAPPKNKNKKTTVSQLRMLSTSSFKLTIKVYLTLLVYKSRLPQNFAHWEIMLYISFLLRLA